MVVDKVGHMLESLGLRMSQRVELFHLNSEVIFLLQQACQRIDLLSVSEVQHR